MGADGRELPAAEGEEVPLSRRAEARPFGLDASMQLGMTAFAAWATSVLPIAWRAEATAARFSTVLPILGIVTGLGIERSGARRGRTIAIWSFSLGSLAAWLLDDSTASASEGGLHALVTWIAWGLFGYVAAAPAIHRAAPSQPLRATHRSRVLEFGLDNVAIVVATLVSAAWATLDVGPASTERALALRVLALVAGLATVGSAAQLARQKAPLGRSGRRRARWWLAFVVLFAMLGFWWLVVRRLLGVNT